MGSPGNVRLAIMLALGMATFAFAPILVRVAGQVDPIALATYRTVSAALILLPFWWMGRAEREVPPDRYSGREKMLLVFAGLSLGLHFICWIAALMYTSVASASVLVAIHPVILIVVESVFMKRKFPLITWSGVALAFAGSAFLGYSDSAVNEQFSNPLLGNMLALAAAGLFVVYFLLSRSLRQKSNWLDFVFRVYVFTALTCVGMSLITGAEFSMGWIAILAAVGLAVGPQIIGHGSMNFAVKYVSPTLLSTLILAEPVFATVLAFLFFAELPAVTSIFAMVVILCGILLSWSLRTKIKPAPST